MRKNSHGVFIDYVTGSKQQFFRGFGQIIMAKMEDHLKLCFSGTESHCQN